MDFSKRLYELRKQKGLSQEELADRLNVSRQTLSKWELGVTTPELEKAVQLSDFFEISLDELILGEKESKDTTDKGSKNTVAQVLNDKILTPKNKAKTKKGLKILLIALGVIFIIDFASMIIYFAFFH